MSTDHVFTINIPKLRKLATDSNTLIKKSPYVKKKSKRMVKKLSASTLKKYSLPEHEPMQVMSLKEELVLCYKLYAKKQERVRHLQRLDIDVIQKYKIMYTDLRKRLYVENPPDDVFAVTDIDDTYFRYLSGRPLAKYIPRYKSLNFLYSDALRLRQEIGYRSDTELNIESNYRHELKINERSVARYKEQVKYFDQFISEDYTKSMDLLKKWDGLKDQVEAVLYEEENLATREFTITSRLIGLDYSYSLQQKYGRFLYYLAPPSWRVKHREFAHSVEIEAKGFDLGISSEEDTFNQIFDKMKTECYRGLISPPLYFEQPHQIMDLFETIEKQQLHHFSYVTHLAPHEESLKTDIVTLKEAIFLDSYLTVLMIQRFERMLLYYDEKEEFLHSKFLKILYDGMFFESVGAIDVLKFKLHLEFCYEKLFSDTPTNMTMSHVARCIEEFYVQCNNMLDDLHNDKIKLATRHLIEVGKMKIKKAKMAARELRLFNRLERELLIAFEPIHKPDRLKVIRADRATVATLGRHSHLKTQSVAPSERPSTRHSISDAQKEYLTLFTDWNGKEDPGKYLQCLKLDKRHSVNTNNSK